MKNAETQGIPLLGKGGVDATSKKYREASFEGADGVVRSTSDNRWIERTTPSEPTKKASRNLYYWRSHPSFAKEGIAFLLTLLLTTTLLVTATPLHAQSRGTPPRNPKDGAPIDLTGYWVSIVSEDWRFRMVTPPRGDYPNFPLNDAAKKVTDAWDPARDEAAAEQCKSYGAPNVMRNPTRLHITWANDATLQVEVDAGTQTRLLRFGNPAPPQGRQDWQGFSVASWEGAASGRGPGGSLKVVTTRLRPGYLQKNGVPYSGAATLTEYFDVVKEPTGEQWLVVKSILEDPAYLTRTFIRSTHFRKQANEAGWNPTACSAR
jgi:hypothetical protein